MFIFQLFFFISVVTGVIKYVLIGRCGGLDLFNFFRLCLVTLSRRCLLSRRCFHLRLHLKIFFFRSFLLNILIVSASGVYPRLYKFNFLHSDLNIFLRLFHHRLVFLFLLIVHHVSSFKIQAFFFRFVIWGLLFCHLYRNCVSFLLFFLD